MSKVSCIPELLLEFHDVDGGCLQLWNTEITSSQADFDVLTQLQRGANLNQDIQVITLLSISENKRYHPPSASSTISKEIEQKTGNQVADYRKWLHKRDNPVFGEVTGWMIILPILQARPEMDEVGLGAVQNIIARALLKVRDRTLQHLDTVLKEEDEEEDENDEDDEREDACAMEEDESNVAQESNDSVDPFEATHAWTPPELPINWKTILFHLKNAARQTGYTRYATWHEALILKRKAGPIPENLPSGERHPGLVQPP
ncbi:uncharacterized protein HD556DRAFT_1485336 [Suillus plorans]|uniref:Uncharacterized protein n=1 Tax=Suillus plorans TaxID=116603 RepID=A0A9P7AL62_9AGAM|nr:uncharacterized protein HD556DRAFT_1485336 [Suillus plorans]KAG1791694.1 hypothetical protein HD556DRAFT_1485336 [Suillus plorans]